MKKPTQKGENSAGSKMAYIIGSFAVLTAMSVASYKWMPYVSGIVNKQLTKISNIRRDDDDWGPIIEKKK